MRTKITGVRALAFLIIIAFSSTAQAQLIFKAGYESGLLAPM